MSSDTMIPILLSCPSHNSLLEPLFKRLAAEMDGVHAHVYVTPPGNSEKIEAIIGELYRKKFDQPIPIVTSANGYNTLADRLAQRMASGDVIISIPIADETDLIAQYAGILHASTIHQRSRILTVPFNAGYTALNIAARFAQHEFDEAVIPEEAFLDGFENIERTMRTFEIQYRIKRMLQIGPDELVLSPFQNGSFTYLEHLLIPLDRKLSEGKGVQIAARTYEPPMSANDLAKYRDCFDASLTATGFTAPRNSLSALIVVAQFLRHPRAVDGLSRKVYSKQELELVAGSGYEI